jgi:hypothetical protein
LAGDVEINPGPDHDLSICHLNVQSLRTKLELVAVELGQFDILTVSETWLDQSISTPDIKLPNYQDPIRLDRNRQGGGVAMYFKQSIPFLQRTDLIVNDVEAVWAEIHLNSKKVLIGCFYLHPRFTDWNSVEYSIEQALESCSNLILLGDFNENLLDVNKSRNAHNLMNLFNLNQIVDTPTRITDVSRSMIDLIFITDPLQCSSKGVIEPFCSDHHAVYFTTSFMKLKGQCYQRRVWDYENANYDLYRDILSECNWDLDNKNVDDQVNKITDNIIKAGENSIPNKIVNIRPYDQPWIHNEIRKAIRKRKRVHKIAKETNSPESWSVFRSVRNQVVSLINSSKENYFNKLANNLNRENISPKNWWKLVKKFISTKKAETISFLIKDDKYYSSPIDKANVLNQFFCDQSNLDDYNARLPPFVSPLSCLDTINISNQDVLDVLKNLNINKASGPDLINPRLLKEGAEVLSPHLVKLFNSSLSKSYFPDNWKLANVVPIYKKGDKTNVTNYRPISLLSCIGKTFEKCVFKHMYNFLQERQIITSLQSGFTPGDSSV